MRIELRQDNDARHLLNDKGFIAGWRSLSFSTSTFSVHQDPAFVTSWYESYSDSFFPVIIAGFVDDEISALMFLAFSGSRNFLTHAGDSQAEYHGWLCRNGLESTFIPEALIEIKKIFGPGSWQWRYTPPGSDMSWVRSRKLRENNIFVFTREKTTPVLLLNDNEKITELERNRSIRNKINRYKRYGELKLERLTGKDDLLNIIDTVAAQYDFRQMAIHGVTPFGNDGNKKRFLLSRIQSPDYNHFTVLSNGTRLLAFHAGCCDRDRLHLGLISYDPTEERNSPGSVLLTMLIKLLQQEGFKYFDLSPGGDSFKERYKNHSLEVFLPVICFSPGHYLLYRLLSVTRELIGNTVRSIGPGMEKTLRYYYDIRSGFRRLLRLSMKAYLGAFNSLILRHEYLIILSAASGNGTEISGQPGVNTSIGAYSDLLKYDDSTRWISLPGFLRKAIDHFSNGDILFTQINNDALKQCGWLSSSSGDKMMPFHKFLAGRTTDSILLCDFLTDINKDTADDIFFLLQPMITRCAEMNASRICISLKKNQMPKMSGFLDLGFGIEAVYSLISLVGFSFRRRLALAS